MEMSDRDVQLLFVCALLLLLLLLLLLFCVQLLLFMCICISCIDKRICFSICIQIESSMGGA